MNVRKVVAHIKLQIAQGILDDMKREEGSAVWTIGGNMQYGSIKGGEWKYSAAYYYDAAPKKIMNLLSSPDVMVFYPHESIAIMEAIR